MKIKNIIKRATSAIAAAVLGATALTSALVSAETANPNPTHEATNINFSYTDGYIKYDAHAGYPFPNSTGDEKLWIIKLNNQVYGNLCIHPGTRINSYTTDYYSYQVTSTGDANSNFWKDGLTEGQKYTIGLLMYYGYPNGIDESGIGATSGAAMDATQMLVWEAVMKTRFIPDDYKERTDYSCYANMQYHWEGGEKKYQYTPLRDLYYKLGAGNVVDTQATANTKAYYNYLVNKIVHHKDMPSVVYKKIADAQANAITLKYNNSTKRYEATFTTNEKMFEDFGARTAIGNVGLNVDKQGATAANGNATYVVHTAKYFSGTKVTARMDKQSTVAHENRTPYGTGLQIWAQKLTSKTNPNDTVSVQQTVTGSKADPASAFMAFNAQEVRGDFTVVKKSLKSNGDEDAVLVESVRKDARFMVYDVAAQRYIKTSIDAQGNYQYVSSDGFSNTSTNPGTIFKLNTEGKFTVTNLPLGKTFRVIEYETAAHYEIPKATIEVTLDESNKSQSKEQLNKHTNSLYVSKRVLAESDDKNHINGAELKDAKMSIVAEDGTTFATWTSDGTEHLVQDIPAGKYTLKEIAAPDGYQIATDISFEVDENNKVTATGATVQSKDDIPLIVMFDEVTRTDISKVDATTGKELAGAELKLYDWNDVLVDSWTSSNEPHKVYGLVVGKTYKLEENLAPIGYAKTTDVNFTVLGVDAQGKAQVTKVTMKDEVARGTIRIKKKSEGNTQIANINYILEGQADAGFDFKVEKRTDENGEIVFEKIPVGAYSITEDGETVPIAYLVADPQTVTVQYAQTTEVTFYNKLKKGSIKLHKRAEGDKNKANINFILEGPADAGFDFKLESKTDKDGEAVFENVPIGTYTIIEDGSTVPTAYMTAEPQKVTVNYAETTEVTFYNKLKTGSIEIQKRTSDMTHIESINFILEGPADAGFDVKREAKSGKDGKVTFENVPIGTYTIIEDGSTVPTAYMVAEPQKVTVEYAKTVKVTFKNEEKPDKPETPPQTGLTRNSITIMLLLIGAGAIGAMSAVARKNKEED
ncbi:MAG: Cys-Gln thioester bond-forming surface protein [Ruminococcus sp.]|nr:Cys-Gln thioester bond-forming surface protein [Ruminococcus sp.]